MNSINFNKIKDALSERDNISKLEKSLKDRYFAVEIDNTNHIIQAMVFDNFSTCNRLCGCFPEGKFETMDFGKFKKSVGDDWHNPDCYHFSKCDDDSIVFICDYVDSNNQEHSDNTVLLSEESFEKLVKCITQEQNRYSKDRYFGLTLDSDKLESLLQNKYFAVSKNEQLVKAVICDDLRKCELFCGISKGYSPMDFNGFKSIVGDKWRYPQLYYPQKQSNWIVYIDGEI